LEAAGRTGVRGCVLEIHHAAVPPFDPDFLQLRCGFQDVAISLGQDGVSSSGPPVRCVPAQLPFQDHVFDLVVLHHLVADGGEAELSEAARVLARNGVLLLLGLNRLGWRYRAQGGLRRLPGLSLRRMRSRLAELDLELLGLAGAGLAGRNGPGYMHTGVGRLAVPLADLLLVQVRHRHTAGATPLRFGKPRAVVVQSAPVRG
jgi:SAM-dependent methyltransferase